jgi:hypothetical protein
VACYSDTPQTLHRCFERKTRRLGLVARHRGKKYTERVDAKAAARRDHAETTSDNVVARRQDRARCANFCERVVNVANLTALALSRTAKAHVTLPLRRGGCRDVYSVRPSALCSRRDAVTLVFGRGASAPDRSRAVTASTPSSAADHELVLYFWQGRTVTSHTRTCVRTAARARLRSRRRYSQGRGAAARRVDAAAAESTRVTQNEVDATS